MEGLARISPTVYGRALVECTCGTLNVGVLLQSVSWASVQAQTSSFRSNYARIPLKFRKQTLESPDSAYADASAFASAFDSAPAQVALT